MTAVEDRIAKLLRLAGNNPSEAEASAAAEKAQELMLRYGIEMAQVQLDGGDRIRVDRKTEYGKLDPWRRNLAGAVAQSAGGRFLFQPDPGKWSGSMHFFGPHGTVDGIIASFRFLERELDRMSKLKAAQFGEDYGFTSAADSMRWRRSWLLGASSRVCTRLLERLDGYETSQALVVVKSTIDRAIEDAFESTRKDGYRTQVDAYAYRQGHAEGASIPLGEELEGGERTELKRAR